MCQSKLNSNSSTTNSQAMTANVAARMISPYTANKAEEVDGVSSVEVDRVTRTGSDGS